MMKALAEAGLLALGLVVIAGAMAAAFFFALIDLVFSLPSIFRSPHSWAKRMKFCWHHFRCQMRGVFRGCDSPWDY